MEFNDLADELEKTLGRLFLHCEILCDIEVKGTITHNGKSGKLAKLPFTNKRMMRDGSDGWWPDHLERFVACSVVSTKRIAYKAQLVEDRIDEDRVARFLEHKRSLEKKDKARNKLFGQLRGSGWNGSDKDILKRLKRLIEEQGATSGTVKIPVIKSVEPDQRVLDTKAVKNVSGPEKRVEPAKESGRCEGNAFTRNQNDLLPFVREFYKRHRRLPDVEDALVHLRDNGLFSGEWEDNASRREKRVGQILGFIEDTFDPKELSTGESRSLDLKLGRFSWWVKQRFGSGIKVKTADVRRFDPVAMTGPVRQSVIPARFIETFLVVADFCLNEDPLANRAVPTNRFKTLWKMVDGGACWNQRFFQIVRDHLDQAGVLRIFDRSHVSGKAWRWDAGPNFPAGSWKEEQRQLKERYKPLRGPALSFEELAASSNVVLNNIQHKALYQTDCGIQGFLGQKIPARPPPN